MREPWTLRFGGSWRPVDAEYSDGRRHRIEFEAEWSSSDSTVVDAWAARRSGQAEVCATYRAVRGCATHVVVR